MILDGIHLNDKGQENYCKWISDYCFEFAKNNDIGNGSNGDTENSDDVSGEASDDVSDEVSDEASENPSDVSNATSDSEQTSDDSSDSTVTTDNGMSSTEIAIATIIMFIGISVIGVMFIKVIKKNKK